MKPRIFKSDGLWWCFLPRGNNLRVGLGYTPAHAYEQWRDQA